MKNNIRNAGIYIGALSILSTLINGLFELSGSTASSVLGFVVFAINIGIVVVFVNKQKKSEGGLLSFKRAFRISFLALFIGGFIGLVFNYIYSNFIDPGLIEQTVVTSLEDTYEGIQNLPEDQQEQTLEITEKIIRFIFSFWGIFALLIAMSIFYALISLILAAILKKNPE